MPPSGEHRGVEGRALQVQREVGRAGADVGDRHAQLPLRLGQHRLARRERGDDQLVHPDAGLADALGQVLERRRGAVDDVGLHLQADRAHADGVLDALLAVDREVTRQDVEHLAVGRDGHRPRHLRRPVDILAAHLAMRAADGDRAPRVEALDLAAADTHEGRLEPQAGQPLGRLDRLPDGRHRLLDVVDDPLLEAVRGHDPLADDADGTLTGDLADQRHDLARADVERDEDRFDLHRSPSRHRAAPRGGPAPRLPVRIVSPPSSQMRCGACRGCSPLGRPVRPRASARGRGVRRRPSGWAPACPARNVPHRSAETASVTPSTVSSRSRSSDLRHCTCAGMRPGGREGLGVVPEHRAPVAGRREHPAVVVVQRQEQRRFVAADHRRASPCPASRTTSRSMGSSRSPEAHRRLGPLRRRRAGSADPVDPSPSSSSVARSAGANATPSTSTSQPSSPTRQTRIGSRSVTVTVSRSGSVARTRALATVGSCSMAASMLRVEMMTVAGRAVPVEAHLRPDVGRVGVAQPLERRPTRDRR